MDLIVQIKSLLFSFAFGVLFNTILNVFEKYIYSAKLLVKIISSFFISILSSLIYFWIIIKINDGIIHVYFVGIIVIGYYLDYKYFDLHKKITKTCKKMKIKVK